MSTGLATVGVRLGIMILDAQEVKRQLQCVLHVNIFKINTLFFAFFFYFNYVVNIKITVS